MKRIIVTVIVILIISAAVFVVRGGYSAAGGGQTKSDVIKRTRFLMDTIFIIQVPISEKNIEPSMDLAFNRIEEVDRKFNHLNPQSPVYDFDNKGTPITDPEIIHLIKEAQEISEMSDGAFDITIEPVVDLWGFYTNNMHLPADKDIQEALKNVGYRHLIVRDDRVTADRAGIKIDLGAIAKGYGIGEALKVLKAQGIKSALIDAGQTCSLGTINGGPWKVGIRNPRGNGLIAGLALVNDMGIATSGDYERYFEANGQRYHHIFDPRTGYPAKGVMSVSVITQGLTYDTYGDGYSTAFFVMGADKAMKLAESKPGMDLIIVTTDGNIQCSKGLENMFISKK